MAYLTASELAEKLAKLQKITVLTSKRSEVQASALKERVEVLEKDVGELALICHSLLTALCSQPVLDQEKFFKTLHDVDASDGSVDGQYDRRSASKGAGK